MTTAAIHVGCPASAASCTPEGPLLFDVAVGVGVGPIVVSAPASVALPSPVEVQDDTRAEHHKRYATTRREYWVSLKPQRTCRPVAGSSFSSSPSASLVRNQLLLLLLCCVSSVSPSLASEAHPARVRSYLSSTCGPTSARDRKGASRGTFRGSAQPKIEGGRSSGRFRNLEHEWGSVCPIPWRQNLPRPRSTFQCRRASSCWRPDSGSRVQDEY